MEIRLTRHAPVDIAAVSVAREGRELPDEVRVVEQSVADAVEDLVRRVGDDVAGMDLDAIIERATTPARS